MDIVINIILDVLHITKFFIIGDLFLVLPRKNNRIGKSNLLLL